VILQGVLGGLTVLYLLPTAISVAHGVLAQTFLLLTILIAFTQSKRVRKTGVSIRHNALFQSALILTLLVYIQLILGALVRHTDSALAIPDFPRMGGEWIPSFSFAMLERINAMRAERFLANVDFGQVLIHLLHRLGAVLVSIAAIVLFVQGGKLRSSQPQLWRLSAAMLFLVVCQFFLGTQVVFTLEEPWITSLHVFVGALILAGSFTVALSCLRPSKVPEPEHQARH
jgi:cytochrome c oxidase assembly protein subunit 15